MLALAEDTRLKILPLHFCSILEDNMMLSSLLNHTCFWEQKASSVQAECQTTALEPGWGRPGS